MTEATKRVKITDTTKPVLTDPFTSLKSQLNLMIRARYGLIYMVGSEEDPMDDVIVKVSHQLAPPREVLFWDIVRGWSDNHAARGSIMAALERVHKFITQQDYMVIVLRDLHPFFKSPQSEKNIPIIRELRNLARELKHSRTTLIFTSHCLEIPDDLREEVTVIDFPLPDVPEISLTISQLVEADKLRISGLALEQLVKACQGLSRARIRRVLGKALAAKQQVNESDIDGVLEEKRQAIRQTGILEFLPSQESLKRVGGLENLKQWVKMRQDAFTDEARRYGIPNPKGVLLVGIQGTGKSLSAKTIAHEWRLPLLRLDAGRLFGGIVGESESRVRQMIQLVEAIAPCVLWIDEIDKAFGNITGGVDGDSGTSRRVFGSLITWMQEKNSPVFIVATANNVRILPAELLRKGRFDEIFFLNLPTELERQEIFKVHLQRLRPAKWRDFDLTLLAKCAKDFSGAEIEQVIIDGLYRAFGSISQSQRSDLTTEDILRAIEETVPLAAIASQQIKDLKLWAAEAGARTASQDHHLVDELKHYHQQRGLQPLEVDSENF